MKNLLHLTLYTLASTLLSLNALAANAQIIKIGHVAPLSGAIAHLGKDMENSALMATEELNAKGLTIEGKQVRFVLVSEDDGGDPKQSGPAAQKLVDAKVNAVIGHTTSGTAIPAAKIYGDAGIPQIASTVTAASFTAMGIPSAFRLIASDKVTAAVLGTYAVHELQAKTIAVIDDRTAYGQGIADLFIKSAKASNPGLKLLPRQFTNDKATDFNAILTAAKAGKPDLIFFGGMDAVAGPMLRQIKALGITSKFMGGDGACTEKIPELAGNSLRNDQIVCAISGGLTPAQRVAQDSFKERYKKRFEINPQTHGAYVYDAVMTVADAMQQAKSSEPGVYLPFLRKIHHKGITGTIAFDSKGDLIDAAVSLYTFQNGKRVLIKVSR